VDGEGAGIDFYGGGFVEGKGFAVNDRQPVVGGTGDTLEFELLEAGRLGYWSGFFRVGLKPGDALVAFSDLFLRHFENEGVAVGCGGAGGEVEQAAIVGGGEAEPFIGFGGVLADEFSFAVELAEFELGAFMASGGGFQEEGDGFVGMHGADCFRGEGAVGPGEQDMGELVLGVDNAAGSRAAIPCNGVLRVAMLTVHVTELVLGGRIAGFGGGFEVDQGRVWLLSDERGCGHEEGGRKGT